MKTLSFTITLSLLSAVCGAAGPKDGFVWWEPRENITAGNAAVTKSGKILTSGSVIYKNFQAPDGSYGIVSRLEEGGALDLAFSSSGSVEILGNHHPLPSNFPSVLSVAEDQEGRIVFVGTQYDAVRETVPLVGRLLENGKPDPTFASNGMTDPFGWRGGYRAVKINASGKIVTGGYVTDTDGKRHIAVARYLPSGKLDTSFSTTGAAVLRGKESFAHALDIDGEGRIVAVGRMTDGNVQSLMARWNTNGTLDKSFAGTGYLTSSFGTTSETSIARAVAVVGTDIYMGGYQWLEGKYLPMLVKVDQNGNRLFSHVYPAKDTASIMSLALGPQGLLGAGTIWNGKDWNFYARCVDLCSTTESFGDEEASVSLDFDGQQDVATTLHVQKDGKVVLYGTAQGADKVMRFGAIRLQRNGTIDQTFGK